MTTATAGYTLVEDDSRIDALGADGVAICGAYQPAGHDYWCFFVTRLVSDLTGLTTPPHREHFWGENGRYVVKMWIELIASLYVMALQQKTSR